MTFPPPDRHPELAEELLALVDARSQCGTDLLACLMANGPTEAFIVLAGRAYTRLRINGFVDEIGNCLNQRVANRRERHFRSRRVWRFCF